MLLIELQKKTRSTKMTTTSVNKQIGVNDSENNYMVTPSASKDLGSVRPSVGTEPLESNYMITPSQGKTERKTERRKNKQRKTQNREHTHKHFTEIVAAPPHEETENEYVSSPQQLHSGGTLRNNNN